MGASVCIHARIDQSGSTPGKLAGNCICGDQLFLASKRDLVRASVCVHVPLRVCGRESVCVFERLHSHRMSKFGRGAFLPSLPALSFFL